MTSLIIATTILLSLLGIALTVWSIADTRRKLCSDDSKSNQIKGSHGGFA